MDGGEFVRVDRRMPEPLTNGCQRMIEPDDIERMLIACARRQRDLTYAEALREFGLRFTRPRMRELCRVLAIVDERARERGEPHLAVLVVRASDRLPGDGWWASRSRYFGETAGEAATHYVRRLQQRVFVYWKKH
jgi:hypothetical protein